ncbi:MAG: aspartate kinase [Deltaproteobacteria bacterium]|nr:aspartate kinase [Deltaproteobacteria bacterium]
MLIVQKYGGTSVGTVERIHAVARRCVQTQREGHQVVVVASAMSGETNRLIGLARQVSPDPNERELDALVATGEQQSVALLAMAIRDQGAVAQSYTGGQIRLVTDNAFTKARIRSIDEEMIRSRLRQGEILVIAGFQGVDPEGNVTTLGRGGSDTTAVAVAAALKADRCDIYTDVDGVYTADPNVVSGARKIDRISYEEMLELASLGAKVLQLRSVELALKYKVPLRVVSSFDGPGVDPQGTLVCEEDAMMEKVLVTGVSHSKSDARITVRAVPDKPGVAARLFGALAEANISVDVIVQTASVDHRTDLSFTVPRSDHAKALKLSGEVATAVGASGVESDERIGKVSIVGAGMRSHAGVAAQMFDLLAREGVNIQMISTSEIKVSCVIDEKYTELAVRALHDGFGLGKAA